MQIVSLTKPGKKFQRLDSKTSLRLRSFRLLSEKYTHRERPSVAAEFILFAVIVLTAAWPVVTMAHAFNLIR
jgi:hypothetical protein